MVRDHCDIGPAIVSIRFANNAKVLAVLSANDDGFRAKERFCTLAQLADAGSFLIQEPGDCISNQPDVHIRRWQTELISLFESSRNDVAADLASEDAFVTRCGAICPIIDRNTNVGSIRCLANC